MKRNTPSVIKFKKLGLALGMPSYSVAGILELLWHISARETPRGDIGKLTNEEIALGMDWDKDPDVLIGALIACKWLDEDVTHRLIVHDWSDHAEDAIHTKLYRAIQTFADGSMPKARSIGLEEKKRLDVQWSSLQVQTPAPDGIRTSAVGMPDVLPLPKPLPKPITTTLPSSAEPVEVDEVVAVAESPSRFDLEAAVEELYEQFPPDRRGRSPGRDKAWIKSCLMGCGMDPPEVHFAKVQAGVERLLRCLESGYDRKFIPGFQRFFEPANGQWRDEWLPIEHGSPGTSGKVIQGVSLYDPDGVVSIVPPDEVEDLLAQGWTREPPKRDRAPSPGALKLAGEVLGG